MLFVFVHIHFFILGGGCGGASGCGAAGCGAAGCGGGKLELLYHVYETSMIRIHFFMCIYTLNSRLYALHLFYIGGCGGGGCGGGGCGG